MGLIFLRAEIRLKLNTKDGLEVSFWWHKASGYVINKDCLDF